MANEKVQDLQAAIAAQDTDAIHSLLNAGADINARGTAGYTLLENAILDGKNDAVAVLLERGADTELRSTGAASYTALHCAAHYKNQKAAELVLQYRPELDARSGHQATPLHLAATMGALAIVKMLIEAGAEVTPVDDEGRTPRDCAQHMAETQKTQGIEPHFDTLRFLQKVEQERGLDRESIQAQRALVENDIAKLKSYHPERYRLAPKLRI